MNFVSVSFAALYVAALALRVALGGSRNVYLFGVVVLSWIFYAWHVPEYLALLLFSTTVHYVAARLIAVAPPAAARVRCGVLVVALSLNVALLAIFKYAGFVATIAGLAVPEIALPIGISFFTFQSMSYTIDVYRGQIAAEKSFMRFACYVAFFPQLVAGPIVRAGDFLYQLGRRRRVRLRVVAEGAYLIVRGLFLKVVVADNLGRIVDAHWDAAAGATPQGTLALSMVVFFSCQLFCDFAGYTDIARGLAYQLGLRLPINFNAPYLAATFTDFWRRWHITLSTWFRDYVYVPLGGNRRGRARASLNLLLVMLLAGLWHGANWTFVLWGAGLGTAVAIERALGLVPGPGSRARAVLWYGVVQLTWVLSLGMFRANDAAEGWRMIRNAVTGLLVLPTAGVATPTADGLIIMGWWFTLPVVALHLRALLTEAWGVRSPGPYEKAAYAGAMLAALPMLYTTTQQFIYFQF